MSLVCSEGKLLVSKRFTESNRIPGVCAAAKINCSMPICSAESNRAVCNCA